MEPLIVHSILKVSRCLKWLEVLKFRCIDGITANVDRCRMLVHNSIGLVTALNPVLGYEVSSKLAKEALVSGRSVYELVLEQKLMSKEQLDEILAPENMIKPRKL
jgi:aspartate ammonia-lyase